MINRSSHYVALSILLFSLFLAHCTTTPTGSLQFTANGEDFVRQGFVSKDGWAIQFEHLYITVADVTAYQTDPPYSAADGNPIEGEAIRLAEPFTIDLALGDETAVPISFATEAEAPVGHFNALSWQMVPATDGISEGATVMLMGTAVKDNQTLLFTLKLNHPVSYRCGEFVGDQRKGFVVEDSTAEIEMTFHFDHIFGDMSAPQDEALNQDALGFEPLAALASNGAVEADSAALEASLAPEAFTALSNALQSLGHVGEGHCFAFNE